MTFYRKLLIPFMGMTSVLALFLFLAQASLAADTRNASIPLAETMKPGLVRLELENTRAIFHSNEVRGTAVDHNSLLGVQFGAAEFGLVGIETGFDWVEPQETEGLPELLLFNFRAGTKTIDDWGFAGALGMRSLGFVAESNDYNIMYGVFEHKMWERFYAAYGGYAGSNQLIVDEKGADESKGFFLGLWYDVQPNGRGRLGAEWTSGDSTIGKLDLGLTVEFDHGIYGNVTISLPNNASIGKTSLQARLAVEI